MNQRTSRNERVTHHSELLLASSTVLKASDWGFGQVTLPHLGQRRVRIRVAVVVVAVIVSFLRLLLRLRFLLFLLLRLCGLALLAFLGRRFFRFI